MTERGSEGPECFNSKEQLSRRSKVPKAGGGPRNERAHRATTDEQRDPTPPQHTHALTEIVGRASLRLRRRITSNDKGRTLSEKGKITFPGGTMKKVAIALVRPTLSHRRHSFPGVSQTPPPSPSPAPPSSSSLHDVRGSWRSRVALPACEDRLQSAPRHSTLEGHPTLIMTMDRSDPDRPPAEEAVMAPDVLSRIKSG